MILVNSLFEEAWGGIILKGPHVCVSVLFYSKFCSSCFNSTEVLRFTKLTDMGFFKERGTRLHVGSWPWSIRSEQSGSTMLSWLQVEIYFLYLNFLKVKCFLFMRNVSPPALKCSKRCQICNLPCWWCQHCTLVILLEVVPSRPQRLPKYCLKSHWGNLLFWELQKNS